MSKEIGSSNTAKKSWFGSLSTKRKLVYLFLLLFVVAWCFFLGFHAAGMWEQHKADAAAEYKISGADLNDENDAYIPTDLSGFRTVLLVGYDIREGYEVGRSDTIMVAFLNLDDKSVKLLSIPRDSYAAQYCKDKNLNYLYPDSLDWLNQRSFSLPATTNRSTAADCFSVQKYTLRDTKLGIVFPFSCM